MLRDASRSLGWTTGAYAAHARALPLLCIRVTAGVPVMRKRGPRYSAPTSSGASSGTAGHTVTCPATAALATTTYQGPQQVIGALLVLLLVLLPLQAGWVVVLHCAAVPMGRSGDSKGILWVA